MPKQLRPRERLALHMDDRRLDLDLRWADVAEAAGVTTETLRQVRSGDGAIRPLTKRRVESALGWKRGSINAILAGGEPQVEDIGEVADHTEAAILADPVLTDRQKRTTIAQLRAMRAESAAAHAAAQRVRSQRKAAK